MHAAKEVALKDFNQKQLKDLTLHQSYPIIAMRRIITKYGMAIVCDLQDGEETNSVFLPKRYADVYIGKDDVLAALQPLALGLTVKSVITLPNGITTYSLDIDYIVKQ